MGHPFAPTRIPALTPQQRDGSSPAARALNLRLLELARCRWHPVPDDAAGALEARTPLGALVATLYFEGPDGTEAATLRTGGGAFGRPAASPSLAPAPGGDPRCAGNPTGAGEDGSGDASLRVGGGVCRPAATPSACRGELGALPGGPEIPDPRAVAATPPTQEAGPCPE